MLRKFLLRLKAGHLQALRQQQGQSIIIFTFAFIGLIAMLGLALDLGLVYIEKVKVNRTADASALAAVVELPYEQDTINRAIEYIELNGYQVGVDTDILVRGCVVTNTTFVDSAVPMPQSHVFNLPPGGPQNIGEPGFTNPMTRTTLITGATYISATQRPPRATFVVDTGSYQSHNQDNDDDEECANNNLGTATKLRVAGRVNVHMNFMQFFGFREVPVEDTATAENLSSLDVMIVFDVSGSMEDQTICQDCWVRTSYEPNWPNNGYVNPYPYDKSLSDNNPPSGGQVQNQSVPNSFLCTAYPPQPFIPDTNPTLKYLTLEAELYSRNVSDWGLDVRTPGQGFWAMQRASYRSGNSTLAPGTNLQNGSQVPGEDNYQRNQAGNPAEQSSNVCRPGVEGNQIDCTVGAGAGDNVCNDDPGNDIVRDCSAYMQARTFVTYGQQPGNIPNLNGGAYNANCFSGTGLSGACWSGNPFNSLQGMEKGPSNVPWLEYDFTPSWSGNTYIWIRAIGGGDEAYTWAGPSPDQLTDINGGGVGNNITPWRKVIYWQTFRYVDQNGNGRIEEDEKTDLSNIFERKDNLNTNYSNNPDDFATSYYFRGRNFWRDSRAENGNWRWIRLNDDDGTIRSISLISGTQYTLRLFQGSTGYKIDKIVFTNDSSGSTPEGSLSGTVPAVLRRNATGGTAGPTDYGNQLGPPASFGSATREACNVCNPIFGYEVTPAQCSCRRTGNETGYGSGLGCTLVSTNTNQTNAELVTGLYSGLQPLRSAQEAVKKFARKLDPQFDQLGIVAFTSGQDNTDAQADARRRSKLQCLTYASQHLGNPARCYDSTLGTPVTYTAVISAVERHWAESGTNIAIGMREGLEELGISTPGNPAVSGACSLGVNDGNACDRRGAARRIIILMTDGSPNANPGNCAPGSGRPDLWDGLLGTDDDDFECAMYFAWLADQNNVTVYTIGIGAGANRDLLTAMATGTDPRGEGPAFEHFVGEGQYFPAAKPTDLDLIFEQILSNIYVRIVS